MLDVGCKANRYFMKNVSFLIFILFVGCSHNSNNIVGKWQFVDFYNYQDPDTTKQNEARTFWTHYKMYFDPNKNYNTEGIYPDTGRWDFNEKNKTIKLIYTTGNEEILNVVDLDNKKLIITFPDNKGLIFKKISSN